MGVRSIGKIPNWRLTDHPCTPPSRTFEREPSALFERSQNKKLSCTKVEPNRCQRVPVVQWARWVFWETSDFKDTEASEVWTQIMFAEDGVSIRAWSNLSSSFIQLWFSPATELLPYVSPQSEKSPNWPLPRRGLLKVTRRQKEKG